MEFEKLVKKLSQTSRDGFEKAVGLASSRSHDSVDTPHVMTSLLESDDSDLNKMLSFFDFDTTAALMGLAQQLDQMKSGFDGFPKIGSDVARLLFESWMLASSEFQSLSIHPAHLLLAAVASPKIQLSLIKASPEFEKLESDSIREHCEALLVASDSGEGVISPDDREAKPLPALSQYAQNMTELARQGKYDRILGRDNEIRQMIDILCRRKQNNPILTGEAGVGKTAVVEGLAARIVSNEVPQNLIGTEIYSLDLGLLQAGAGVKGEFENRLQKVIQDVKKSPTPIILFVDEAHTLIGAGNQAGGGDAANLLKPALARGELRTIAATTWAEYKKYIESDAALTRRFQVVKVEEPDVEQAVIMLRSLAPVMESHHGIVVLDEAIRAAVELSHRYISGRQLPDKCVSLLDTACARVNLSRASTPAEIERLERIVENANFERERLTKDAYSGIDHTELMTELDERVASATQSLETLKSQWDQEQQTIQRIGELRASISASESEADSSDESQIISKLSKERQELTQLQGDHALVRECVDADVIAEVVADWTGIPVGRMSVNELDSILSLQDHLKERVVGQPEGIEKIAQCLRSARAGLADPRRPLGVFMLVGPSGVGKTETAMSLAERLYGSEQQITTINMSEFKEEHKVSLLMGAPPGYVGYGEGGVLTEAVRRKPYSVVLLDEMEKAHPGVQDIFYQVFDKGMLKDGEGRDIDFRNTVIIMTSNTASEQIENLCADPLTKPDSEGLLDSIAPTLRETYKPAFLGRINVIPYWPLDADSLSLIARMQLNHIAQRIQDKYKAPLEYSDGVLNYIISQCHQSDVGARQVASLLNNVLVPQLAEKLLIAAGTQDDVEKVELDIDDNNVFTISVS